MSFLAWFSRNSADTDAPGNPSVGPLDLPIPLAEAMAHVQHVVGCLPRWKIEEVVYRAAQDANGFIDLRGVPEIIRGTRRSRFWHFVDDVTIRLEVIPTGTRLHARSQSRIGKGDLGQNRRNLRELLNALLTHSPPPSRLA